MKYRIWSIIGNTNGDHTIVSSIADDVGKIGDADAVVIKKFKQSDDPFDLEPGLYLITEDKPSWIIRQMGQLVKGYEVVEGL